MLMPAARSWNAGRVLRSRIVYAALQHGRSISVRNFGESIMTFLQDTDPIAPETDSAPAATPLPLASRRGRPVALALQGGGSYGAFTWGVLDRLLQSDLTF